MQNQIKKKTFKVTKGFLKYVTKKLFFSFKGKVAKG